jgi:hypothetical protein
MYNHESIFSPKLIDDAFSALLLEAEDTAFSLFFQNKAQKGTIAKKKIKGKTYVYLQTYKNGKYKYTYLGPENNSKVIEIVENIKKKRVLLKHLKEREKLFIKTFKKLGIIPVSGVMETILQNLSEGGIISGESGILIGTLAFFSYQVKLGFIIPKETPVIRTSDVDIGRADVITLITKLPVNLSEILEKLGDTFVPEGRISEGFPLRLVHLNSGIKIEVLAVKKGNKEVIPPLKSGFSDVGALALAYIDFLMDTPISAIIPGERHLIPVYVPSPERFALHKLIVAGKRASTLLKAQKDISQAYILLKVLSLRGETALIEEAFEELKKKYLKFKKVKNYFQKGLKFLHELFDFNLPITS